MEDSEGRAGLATDMTVNSKVGSGPSGRGDRSKVPPIFFWCKAGSFTGWILQGCFQAQWECFRKPCSVSVCEQEAAKLGEAAAERLGSSASGPGSRSLSRGARDGADSWA